MHSASRTRVVFFADGKDRLLFAKTSLPKNGMDPRLFRETWIPAAGWMRVDFPPTQNIGRVWESIQKTKWIRDALAASATRARGACSKAFGHAAQEPNGDCGVVRDESLEFGFVENAGPERFGGAESDLLR